MLLVNENLFFKLINISLIEPKSLLISCKLLFSEPLNQSIEYTLLSLNLDPMNDNNTITSYISYFDFIVIGT